MPEIERTCLDIRVPYRSSSSSLLFPVYFSLFHHFPSLLVLLIPRNAHYSLFSCSSMLDLLRLFTSRPRWKNFAWNGEKYGEMLDSKRKNRRKTKNCFWMVGEWDSNTGLFGGKTRTIAIEPRKHSSMILLFYLYQVTRYIKLDQIRTWIILDKTIISFIAQRFDVIKNIVRIFWNNCYKILSSFFFLLLKDSAIICQNISSPSNFSSKNARQCLLTD